MPSYSHKRCHIYLKRPRYLSVIQSSSYGTIKHEAKWLYLLIPVRWTLTWPLHLFCLDYGPSGSQPIVRVHVTLGQNMRFPVNTYPNTRMSFGVQYLISS